MRINTLIIVHMHYVVNKTAVMVVINLHLLVPKRSSN